MFGLLFPTATATATTKYLSRTCHGAVLNWMFDCSKEEMLSEQWWRSAITLYNNGPIDFSQYNIV